MVSFEAISGFITSTILMMEKVLSKYDFSKMCNDKDKDIYNDEIYIKKPNR